MKELNKELLLKIWNAFEPNHTNNELIEGLELKKVKEFRGHDGMPLLQAELFYNGEKIAYISEDGHGGEFNINEAFDNVSELDHKRAMISELYTKVDKMKNLSISEYFPDGHKINLDWYLGDLLYVFQLYGQIQRARKKTVYFIPETKEQWTVNSAYNQETKDWILKKHPTAIIFHK